MTTRASDHLTAAVDAIVVGLLALRFLDVPLVAAITLALVVHTALVAVFSVHRRHGLRLSAAPLVPGAVPAVRPVRLPETRS